MRRCARPPLTLPNADIAAGEGSQVTRQSQRPSQPSRTRRARLPVDRPARASTSRRSVSALHGAGASERFSECCAACARSLGERVRSARRHDLRHHIAGSRPRLPRPLQRAPALAPRPAFPTRRASSSAHRPAARTPCRVRIGPSFARTHRRCVGGAIRDLMRRARSCALLSGGRRTPVRVGDDGPLKRYNRCCGRGSVAPLLRRRAEQAEVATALWTSAGLSSPLCCTERPCGRSARSRC